MLFIFPLYLWIYDYLTLSTVFFDSHIHEIFLAINLIAYLETIFWICCVILYYINWNNNKLLKIKKWSENLNSVWYKNEIEQAVKNKLTAKKSIKITTKLLFVTVINIFIIFSVFDLGFTQNVHGAQWAITGVLYIVFSLVFTWIILKNLYSPFCIYFFILLFIVFLIHCAAMPQSNEDVWILQRITYIGIFPTYLQEGLIHDLVLLTCFVLFIKNSVNCKWNFKAIKQNKYAKLFFKNLDVSLISVSCFCIAVIVPSVQACTWSLYYVNLKSAQDVNLLGMSQASWDAIQKINFHDNLVFSDIYLPLANQTLSFNINHLDYPAYGNLQDFYNYKLIYHQPLININGDRITNYNAQNFSNEILPYYNFVVIKSNDQFLINILEKNSNTYHEWLNISNQLLIYRNNDVNAKLQGLFVKYNPLIEITKK